MPTLKNLPLDAIQSTPKNPRSTQTPENETEIAGEDLRGLAASMGSEKNPRLVEPPVVEQIGDNAYRIIAGERRIQAARMAGWTKIPCLVHLLLDPADAHTLRLVENLHRKELHPLDQAAALKIAWLTANADALDLQAQAREILAFEQPAAETIPALETLLHENGFVPTHPVVSWDVTLDNLGLALSKNKRKRLLSVLGIDSEVQEKVREIEMSDASLRALGKLEAQHQVQLVEAIEEKSELAGKVRRIAHAVKTHDYTLDDAIREAQGEVVLADQSAAQNPDVDDDESNPPNEDGVDENLLMDTVVALMEIADQWGELVDTLNELAQGKPWNELPEPWGGYAHEACQKIIGGNADVM